MASPKSQSSSSVVTSPEELSVVQVLDSSEPLVSNSSLVPSSVQVFDSSEPLVHQPIPGCSSSVPVKVWDFNEPLVHVDEEPIAGPSSTAVAVPVGATVSSDDLEAQAQQSASSGRRIHLLSEEVKFFWNLRKIHRTFGSTEDCIRFATERGLLPTSKMCRIHRCPMILSQLGRQLGTFRCRKSNCRGKSFSQSLGTWFEEARLPLATIFELMYLFSQNMTYEAVRLETANPEKNTVLSDRTISDWYSYCRETVVIYELEKQHQRPMIGGPGKIVQIDESKFGKRKYNKGRHIEGHWVIGMIEDGSDDLRVEVCPNNERSAEVLVPLIKKHVRVGSIIHTDFWRAYDCLPEHGFIHKKEVNHSDPANRFVALYGTHTQRIESHWRSLKRQFQLANYKGNFEDWLVVESWRQRLRINHVDKFESLLEAVKHVYKI